MNLPRQKQCQELIEANTGAQTQYYPGNQSPASLFPFSWETTSVMKLVGAFLFLVFFYLVVKALLFEPKT